MSIIVWSTLLIALMWALTSRHPIARYLAQGLAVVIALVATAAAFGLLAVGHKAHWTTGGPGMLLIMIGIPICSIIACFFAILAFTTTTSLEEMNPNDSFRTRPLAQTWERYKELTNRHH